MAPTKIITTAEMIVYNPGLLGTETLYYSTSGFTSKPSETPANKLFDGRMMYQPNIKRTAFSDARVLGGAEVSAGEIVFNNRDQGLSFLLNYGINGRDLTVRVGNDGATYPAGFNLWMKGVVEQVECSIDTLTLRLRDRMQVLTLPIQTARYAGTNSGSPLSGAEGVADISGKVKPIAYGRCRHVPAIMVNTSKLTYQVADGSIFAIDAVYDQGNGLTAGANYANLALLEAAAVPASTYITCLALGLFRIPLASTGRVTADIRGNNVGGYVNKVGEIVQRILIDRCGYVSGDLLSSSFTTLNSSCAQEVGIWIGDDTDIKNVLNKLLVSVGAFLTSNRSGLWMVARLEAPSGAAVATITNRDIISIERVPTRDATAGIPAYRAVLNYKPYYAKYNRSDLAGVVSEANKSDYTQEYRSTFYENAPVKSIHLLSPKIEYNTCLDSASDTLTEATRVQGLHGVRRDLVRLKVPFTTDFTSIDINDPVDIISPLLGYGSGRQFRCVGVGSDGVNVEIDLWG